MAVRQLPNQGNAIVHAILSSSVGRKDLYTRGHPTQYLLGSVKPISPIYILLLRPMAPVLLRSCISSINHTPPACFLAKLMITTHQTSSVETNSLTLLHLFPTWPEYSIAVTVAMGHGTQELMATVTTASINNAPIVKSEERSKPQVEKPLKSPLSRSSRDHIRITGLIYHVDILDHTSFSRFEDRIIRIVHQKRLPDLHYSIRVYYRQTCHGSYARRQRGQWWPLYYYHHHGKRHMGLHLLSFLSLGSRQYEAR
ncbi:hypothetical protein F4803DRAFT_544264 [Xylaria telfairii]|nr:hypothetical protein F4803DRAFT_544264 [Xylaria telfairii]